MINGKYHKEQIYKGKPIIIDLADMSKHYGEPHYEVMAMRENSIDLEQKWSCSLELAITIYKRMCDKYKDKEPRKPLIQNPLPEKYAKLRDDLKAALAVGKAAEIGEDGGTCNFDSPAIPLPRWSEKLVKRAAEEAGSGAFKWHPYHLTYFVFHPDTNKQGNDRSRNARAMTDYLKTHGYENAFEYCQSD